MEGKGTAITTQTRYRGAMPPKGVRCQLEQRGMRRWDACHPSECPTCNWNLDRREEESNSSEPRE